MNVKTVTYSKVFPLGGYSNEKIGVEIEVGETDDVQKVMQQARQFVEYNHKLNGFHNELSEMEHIISNPDDFTGTQLKRARQRMEEISNAIQAGQKLLTGPDADN